MKLLKSLLFATVLTAGLAYATPSDNSLNQLAEVMPYEALFFETVIAPINEERMALAYGLSSDPSLTDDQRQKALQAFDDYAENLIKTLDTPATQAELKKSYISAARKHFTQAEVDAQIAFYGSEAGKSVMAKSDGVINDYLKTVVPTGISRIESYQKANLTPMQDNIKRILNK